MANEIKSQPYIVIEQRTGLSKYGGVLHTIKMIGVNDRKEYKTYVDPRNHNFQNWAHIVNNPKHGFVIRSCKVKNQEKFLISADSKPIIEWEHDDTSVILAQLEEIWKEEDAKRNATTFRELFD